MRDENGLECRCNEALLFYVVLVWCLMLGKKKTNNPWPWLTKILSLIWLH